MWQSFPRVAERALISWSSGKDSAWALYKAVSTGDVEPVRLLTTFNAEYDRVSMQGVRRDLVEAQAAALGLPLQQVDLPWPCPNEVYEARMGEAMAAAAGDDITVVVFGDLFLEDVRDYRTSRLAPTGIQPVFPIWGSETASLSMEMIAAGLEAFVTAVDTTQLDSSFAGRRFDEHLLADLPEGVDPLGENGEFHTFCFAGPMFDQAISCHPGEIVDRGRFVYADLLPG